MRFSGKVGYGESVEEPEGSGKWVTAITERTYSGDVIQISRQLNPGDKVNSDISISNMISIVADPFAVDNFVNIKYVRWAGHPWIVTDVKVQRPRLILTLGSVYNGPTP